MATRSQIATDDFARTDIGSNWTVLNPSQNNASIDTGKVKGNYSGASGDNPYKWSGAGSFTDDQYSKLKVSGFSTQSGYTWVGVIARASTGTNTTRDYYFYRFHFNAMPGNAVTTELGRTVNGTEEILDSTPAVAWADDDTIEIEVDGQDPVSVRGYRNGVEQHSYSDTSVDKLTAGMPGWTITSFYPRGDDWEGGNLVSATSRSMLLMGVG